MVSNTLRMMVPTSRNHRNIFPVLASSHIQALILKWLTAEASSALPIKLAICFTGSVLPPSDAVKTPRRRVEPEISRSLTFLARYACRTTHASAPISYKNDCRRRWRVRLRGSVAARANFSIAVLIAYAWNEIASHSEGEEFFTFSPPRSLTRFF